MGDNFTRLRVIEYRASDAAYNMALDEALIASCRSGRSIPTLRLYGWSVPSVSLGRFQRASEVDLDYCKAHGIPVVRRPTGGRAILHGNELTYSFSAPSSLEGFGSGVLDSYAKLSKAFTHAFRSLGINALSASRNRHHAGPDGANPLCFSSASYGEISVSGKKIIGSAQRRWPEGFLQQGSIPLILDLEGMGKVFKLNKGDDLQMAGLLEFNKNLTLEALIDAVKSGFSEVFNLDLENSFPDQIEEELATSLKGEKYLSTDWTLAR